MQIVDQEITYRLTPAEVVDKLGLDTAGTRSVELLAATVDGDDLEITIRLEYP